MQNLKPSKSSALTTCLADLLPEQTPEQLARVCTEVTRLYARYFNDILRDPGEHSQPRTPKSVEELSSLQEPGSRQSANMPTVMSGISEGSLLPEVLPSILPPTTPAHIPLGVPLRGKHDHVEQDIVDSLGFPQASWWGATVTNGVMTGLIQPTLAPNTVPAPRNNSTTLQFPYLDSHVSKVHHTDVA